MLKYASVPFLLIACAFALQDTTVPASRVADPFATGWMLMDTNGDGIADFIEGKVVVPARPSAAENAAAANLAARLGYGTTGLTMPPAILRPGSIWRRSTAAVDCSPARRACQCPRRSIRTCSFPRAQPEWPWPTWRREWEWRPLASRCRSPRQPTKQPRATW